MYKKFLLMTVVSLFTVTIMASCTAEPSTSSNENVDSQVVSSEENTAAVDEESSEIALENESSANGIEDGTEVKNAYSFHYFNVDGSLIDYIGAEEFDDWWKANEGKDLSIVDVVKDFNISKEDFIAITRPKMDDAVLEQVKSEGYTEESWYDENVYSLEEIDAIYSEDPIEINRVFCSPIAVFNEADGQIYTLEWLADHSAEDYIAAQLPLNRVEEVLQTASEEEYSAQSEYVSAIEPKLEQAYALAEQENSAAE